MKTSNTLHEKATQVTNSEGEQLEREFWTAISEQNLKSLENLLLPEFQSLHFDGSRDKKGELELIKHLNLGRYTLSNFKTTKLGDTLLVSYLALAEESLDGQQLTEETLPRISVWMKNNNRYQLLSHVNMNRTQSEEILYEN